MKKKVAETNARKIGKNAEGTERSTECSNNRRSRQGVRSGDPSRDARASGVNTYQCDTASYRAAMS